MLCPAKQRETSIKRNRHKKQAIKNITMRRIILLLASTLLAFQAQAQMPKGTEMVDLGLPSGTKWASCNLGAATPGECGDYYCWGQAHAPEPATPYNWAAMGMEMAQCGTEADPVRTTGIQGGANDAARAAWGKEWSVPTYDQVRELMKMCQWQWVAREGMAGYQVRSKVNGVCIFLPATGYRAGEEMHAFGVVGCYWTATRCGDDAVSAHYFTMELENRNIGATARFMGCAIRPVSKTARCAAACDTSGKWQQRPLAMPGNARKADMGSLLAACAAASDDASSDDIRAALAGHNGTMGPLQLREDKGYAALGNVEGGDTYVQVRRWRKADGTCLVGVASCDTRDTRRDKPYRLAFYDYREGDAQATPNRAVLRHVIGLMGSNSRTVFAENDEAIEIRSLAGEHRQLLSLEWTGTAFATKTTKP